MNIAFATILIILIISPGFVFNVSFFSGTFSKAYRGNKFIDQIPFLIVPGLLINLIWYFFVVPLTKYKVCLKTIGLLIIGPNSDDFVSQCFQNIGSNLVPISLYFLSIWIFSSFLGHSIRIVIRKNRLDRKFKFLRIANYWHYFISGEYLDFPVSEPDGKSKEKGKNFSYDDLDAVFMFANVVSNLDNHTLTYHGNVAHFDLDSQGDLKSIYLKNSVKQDVFFEKNSEHNLTFFEDDISGVLMIPFKSITDINIKYYLVEKIGDEKAEPDKSIELTDSKNC
jgi:hypothetical protein